MALEIDEELIYELYVNAVANGVGQFQYGQNGVPSGQTQESYDKRVFEVIAKAALAVFTRKRVLPNYMIGGVNWQTLSAIVSLWKTNTEELQISSFLFPAAQLPIGAMQLHVAALPFPVGEALVGYKGKDFVDNTHFYLPYIPLQLTGVLFDPSLDKRTLSWLSRYATFYSVFSGQKDNAAWLTTSSSLVGTSYPAFVEYT